MHSSKVVGLIFALIFFAVPAAAAPKVYFSVVDSASIDLSGPGGDNPIHVIQDNGSTGDLPNIVRVDSVHGKIYWIDSNLGGIRRANLDGTGIEPVISSSIPFSFVLDVNAQKIYFTNFNQILAADFDGNNRRTVLERGSILGNGFGDIALDVAGQKLYWVEQNQPQIWSVNVDGSGAKMLVDDQAAGFHGILGLDLDVPHGKIYFTRTRSVRRANLDGTGVELVLGLGDNGNTITLDLVAQRFYVTFSSNHGALSSAFDGSDIGSLAIGSVLNSVAVVNDGAPPGGGNNGGGTGPHIATPGAALLTPPQVTVSGTTAVIVMEKFDGAARKAAAKREPAAMYAVISRAAKKKQKLGFTYLNFTQRLSDGSGNTLATQARKRNSKKNVITLKKLAPGTYQTSFQVLITEKRNGVVKVIGKTKRSPSTGFTIAGK